MSFLIRCLGARLLGGSEPVGHLLVLLLDARCWLFVNCCGLLCDACYWMIVACCSLFVVVCIGFVRCVFVVCLLFIE